MSAHLICWYRPRTDKHRFEIEIRDDNTLHFSSNRPGEDWANRTDFKRVHDLCWKCSDYSIVLSEGQEKFRCVAAAMVMKASGEFADGFIVVERAVGGVVEKKYPSQKQTAENDDEDQDDDGYGNIRTLRNLLAQNSIVITRNDRDKIILFLFKYLNQVELDEIDETEILATIVRLGGKICEGLSRKDRIRIGYILSEYIELEKKMAVTDTFST
jgi:hypothetical protein